MATLTYNPNDPEAPEFTEQEQQDIQLGEQIQQAEQQLLAGKYKNAQDLEQAYIELQGKLGQQNEPDEEQPVSEDPEPEETEEETEEVEEDTQDDEGPQLTPEDITTLQNIVGGEKEYNAMLEWAAESINQQEIDMFNHVMEMEDSYACFFAIHALNNAYRNAVGYEGKMLTGKAAADTPEVFRSQAELVAAMDDPRYEKDPAYRLDVEQKLSRSNLVF